jgi:hypothetical protein
MDRCDHGGYCTRIAGHAGCHTATPLATTQNWDESAAQIAAQHQHAAEVLAYLDFPTPEIGA